MDTPTTKVFVSYSRKDRLFVRRLVEGLEAEDEIEVFRDTADILPTEEWKQRLEELLGLSDFIVVSIELNDQTHHLINMGNIDSIKRGAVLVNISRGKVVNEQALIDALEGGVIAGAGLDVFENEPDVPLALCRLDNVVLQSHQGSATVETRAAMAQIVVDNLDLYFEKAEVLTPV